MLTGPKEEEEEEEALNDLDHSQWRTGSGVYGSSLM
jgi:hypothetical protein